MRLRNAAWALVAVAAWMIVGASTALPNAKLLSAADGKPLDGFGTSVSVSVETIAVGAPYRNGGASPGAAYVFVANGVSWLKQAEFSAVDGAAGDHFGTAVAVLGDTMIVGAPDHSETGTVEGAAYVFTRTGTHWTQQAKLLPSDPEAAKHFGVSVALAGDTAVVGADGDANQGGTLVGAGAAYVFTRSGGAWTQQTKLVMSGAQYGDSLGQSVAVSGDTVVAGAAGRTSNAGVAIAFTRNDVGAWTQQATLASALGGSFGHSVSIDGDTAVVGAYGEQGTRGGAHVFERSGGNWTEEAALVPSDAGAVDQFGSSVAVAGDVVLVGSQIKGAAYVFHRVGSTWTQSAEPTFPSHVDGDVLGSCCALSGDTAVVGAPAPALAGNKGAAYVVVGISNVPDIAGHWKGVANGQSRPIGGLGAVAALKYDLDLSITQLGRDVSVSIVLAPHADPSATQRFVIPGRVGTGVFWASRADPQDLAPFVVRGTFTGNRPSHLTGVWLTARDVEADVVTKFLVRRSL